MSFHASVVIPTTTKPVWIIGLRQLKGGFSTIGINQKTESQSKLAQKYKLFVQQPTGLIHQLFDADPYPIYRMDISDEIHAGYSWQLPVLVAHAMRADQDRLDFDADPVSALVWATGEVKADFTVAPVGDVGEKLRNSKTLLETALADQRQIFLFIPAENASDIDPDVSQWLAERGVKIHLVSHLDAVLATLALPALTQATSRPSSPKQTFSSNPYRGLEAFQREHRQLFFGRGRAREEAIKKLHGASGRYRPFLLIHGQSGVGKSSLVRAGLAGDVEDECQADGRFRLAIVTPSERGNDPVATLCQGLNTLLDDPLPPSENTSGAEQVSLLIERLRDQSGVARRLLIIDQLEEIFDPGIASADIEAFGTMLEKIVGSRLVWVVATLRSDALGLLNRSSALARLARDERLYGLQQPSRYELSEIITAPLALAGKRFADRLIPERFADLAAQSPDSLPLLQTVLYRFYEQAGSRKELTNDGLGHIGGFEGALGVWAEDVRETMLSAGVPEDDIDRVLVSLVRIEPETRRTLSRSISYRSETPRESAMRSASGLSGDPGAPSHGGHLPNDARILDFMVAARLASSYGADDGPRVRLAHEILVTHWPHLRGLVERLSAAMVMRDDLEQRAKTWIRSGRDQAELIHSAARLEAAQGFIRERLVGFDAAAGEYVAASVEEVKAQALKAERMAQTELEKAGLERDIALAAQENEAAQKQIAEIEAREQKAQREAAEERALAAEAASAAEIQLMKSVAATENQKRQVVRRTRTALAVIVALGVVVAFAATYAAWQRDIASGKAAQTEAAEIQQKFEVARRLLEKEQKIDVALEFLSDPKSLAGNATAYIRGAWMERLSGMTAELKERLRYKDRPAVFSVLGTQLLVVKRAVIEVSSTKIVYVARMTPDLNIAIDVNGSIMIVTDDGDIQLRRSMSSPQSIRLFRAGDHAIVIGWDLGFETWNGWGQYKSAFMHIDLNSGDTVSGYLRDLRESIHKTDDRQCSYTLPVSETSGLNYDEAPNTKNVFKNINEQQEVLCLSTTFGPDGTEAAIDEANIPPFEPYSGTVLDVPLLKNEADLWKKVQKSSDEAENSADSESSANHETTTADAVGQDDGNADLSLEEAEDDLLQAADSDPIEYIPFEKFIDQFKFRGADTSDYFSARHLMASVRSGDEQPVAANMAVIRRGQGYLTVGLYNDFRTKTAEICWFDREKIEIGCTKLDSSQGSDLRYFIGGGGRYILLRSASSLDMIDTDSMNSVSLLSNLDSRIIDAQIDSVSNTITVVDELGYARKFDLATLSQVAVYNFNWPSHVEKPLKSGSDYLDFSARGIVKLVEIKKFTPIWYSGPFKENSEIKSATLLPGHQFLLVRDRSGRSRVLEAITGVALTGEFQLENSCGNASFNEKEGLLSIDCGQYDLVRHVPRISEQQLKDHSKMYWASDITVVTNIFREFGVKGLSLDTIVPNGAGKIAPAASGTVDQFEAAITKLKAFNDKRQMDEEREEQEKKAARDKISLAWPLKGQLLEPDGEVAADGRIKHLAISANIGTEVRAAHDGRLLYSGQFRKYGYLVLIQGSDGLVTAYGCLGAANAMPNDAVEKGDVIGSSGQCNDQSKPFLHFEVRLDARSVDPLVYLEQLGKAEAQNGSLN